MRRFGLLLMMVALISTNVVCAQAQPPLTRKQIMESADKNRDGKIGRVEFLERMREAFFFVDRNKDGFITVEEYRSITGVDVTRFAAADRNKDRKISMDEFLKIISEDFNAADKSDDGVLEEEEVKAWIAY